MQKFKKMVQETKNEIRKDVKEQERLKRKK
jgi:hypothetical protein